MTDTDFDLTDLLSAGVFFVTGADLDVLEAAARDAGLLPLRIDLQGIADKPGLLARIGEALAFPAGTGANWDALSDRLRDLGWLPGAGHGCVLLFDHAHLLREAAAADFDTLLSVLDEASSDWAGSEVPFWAFLALPDEDFDAIDAAG